MKKNTLTLSLSLSLLVFGISSITFAAQFQMQSIPQPDSITPYVEDNGSVDFGGNGGNGTQTNGVCKITMTNMVSTLKYGTPAMQNLEIILADDSAFDFGSVTDNSQNHIYNNPYAVFTNALVEASASYAATAIEYGPANAIKGVSSYYLGNIPPGVQHDFSITFNSVQDIKSLSWAPGYDQGDTSPNSRTITDFTLKTYNCEGTEINSYPYAKNITF